MGTLSKSYKELTLVEKLKAKKSEVVLLIDVSGSTNRDIEPGCTELQAIRSIVNDLPGNPTMYEFSEYTRKVNKDTLSVKGTGGTMLGSALRTLKLQGHKKILLITDGEATDKQYALEQAKDIKLKILFVGPGNKPVFLDELAHQAGAQTCTKEDLLNPKELTEKITLLIEAGNQARSIQL